MMRPSRHAAHKQKSSLFPAVVLLLPNTSFFPPLTHPLVELAHVESVARPLLEQARVAPRMKDGTRVGKKGEAGDGVYLSGEVRDVHETAVRGIHRQVLTS